MEDEKKTITTSIQPNKGRKRKTNDEELIVENELDQEVNGESTKDAEEKPAFKKPERQSKRAIPAQYGDYFIKNQAIFQTIYNEKREKLRDVRLGRLIRINKIQQDIEKQTVELQVEFYYQNRVRTIIIPREELQKNKLSQLVKYGCDISDSNVVAIQNYLRIQEDSAEYENSHKQLGWAVYEKEEVFKHHTLLGADAESTYNGQLEVEPKGTFEAWEKTIKSEVLPSIPLTFALIAGFASPIVSWIAKDFDLEVILFHIYGDSTMGKTTAARVFVSSFGAPTTKEGGTLLKWSGTANGIIGQIVENMGVPVAIDDASMNKMNDFTEVIYTLAEGTEKARMKRTTENRERRRWAGVLFSTAEHPLMAKTNNNSGLQVRMMELGNIHWTNSKDHADKIKDGLLNNYGHAGTMFVEYILKLGKEEIIKKWRAWQKKCMDSMAETDNLSDRIADKLALVLMAGEIVKECFDWEMDLDGVQMLLIEHDQKKVGKRMVGDEAYRQFAELIAQHRSKFATKDRNEKGHEYWGRINQKGINIEVEILTNVFSQKMGEQGFENLDVILQGWRDKGYLDHDLNKFTRKRAGIQGKRTRQNFHCIKLPSEYMSILKEEQKNNQSFEDSVNTIKTTTRVLSEIELQTGMNEVDDIELL